MLARIVDNWLTSAGELGYQAAFTQLIAVEGQRVLHAPVHHPHEHGKDLIAVDGGGTLFAYQLKGGDIGIAELEEIQGQLFALAGTALTYPGLEPARRPDRVVLVTNGRLSAPARSRLHDFNEANKAFYFPPIEPVERDQLVGRFVAAHGSYLPAEPRDFNRFLGLILKDGRGVFPVKEHASFIHELLVPVKEPPKDAQLQRSLASVTLLTAYVVGPWQRTANHLAVAQGWLALAIETLAFAEQYDLDDEHWRQSFELARDSARAALSRLLDEAVAVEDLVVPDMVEGLFHSVRASLVCGFLAAFAIGERELDGPPDVLERVAGLLLRELEYLQVTGEAGMPQLLMVATVLEATGHQLEAGKIVALWAISLVKNNQPGSADAVADPYHSIEETLLHGFGADTDIVDEQFSGQAFTLHVALEWLARRDARAVVAKLWPEVTRLHFCEFQPSKPARLLAFDDEEGVTETWAPNTPQSWAELSATSKVVREGELPDRLWRELSMIPYLPLLYPQRMTSAVAKALDYIVSGRANVEFDR